MILFIRELKANRKSLIIWSSVVLLMIIGGMAKYSGISGSPQMLNKLMADMPKSLQAIMGVGTLDISTATGFYSTLYLYLVLMMTIHAVMLGATIISKEERDSTAEFLLVKPISRAYVIIAKLSAAWVNILILNGVLLISSIIVVGAYSKGENVSSDILHLDLGIWVLQLLFMFMGAFIAAICKRPKRAASISTAILLATFILSIIIDLSGRIDGLKILTPFKYFEAKEILAGEGFSLIFVGISIFLIVISFILTFVFYKKRDLYI